MAITVVSLGALIDIATGAAAPLLGIAADTTADMFAVLDAIDAGATPAAVIAAAAASADTAPDAE